ncbi:hypothetical protein L7F22_053755 [Adiantum nelumboides]|nr:hypothetical protein [Adiantum nelumboides]
MRCSRIAYGLSESVRQSAMLAESSNYEFLLRHCAETKDLSRGRCLHAHIIESGLDKRVFFANLIVQMYGKCHSLYDAYQVFSVLQHKDVFSWTFMIGAYAQLGQRKDALTFFQQMQRNNVAANAHTFIYLLSGCGSKVALFEGRLVHTFILSSSFERQETVATALVCMYSKCGSIDDALQVFYTSCDKDTISWNAIISMVSEYDSQQDSFNLFQQMQVEGFLPSKGTFLCCLACSAYLALSRIKRIHTLAISCEYNLDVVISNALVTMYGKCGSIKDAHTTFQSMPVQNVISWTALITAYAERGQSTDVVQTLQRMSCAGFTPDKVTFATSLTSCISEASVPDGLWLHCFICDSGFNADGMVGTALLNMYGKCGRVDAAEKVFKKLLLKDVVCWNAMIAVYAQHGLGKKALELLREMGMADLVPDKITFVSILDACANEAALDEGMLLHTCLMQFEFESELIVGNALVNFYGKCAFLADAISLFWKLPKRSLSAWTAIITAYGQQGWGRETLLLSQEMMEDGVLPNEVTFVSVLSSCSHAGMVEEAWEILFLMQQKCKVTARPEHFDCFVDLLGRAGLLTQLQAIIDNMPFHPGANTWMAFLSSCKLHNNSSGATPLALHSLEVDSATAAPYVLLSNIYTTFGNDSEEDFADTAAGEDPRHGWDPDLACAV